MPVTFQIYDFIHQTRVIVLINSGSTHSFIQPRVAKFLSLALHDTSLLRVMVDNGSILECQQRCADIPLILHGHSFTVTLHLLPISDADIVLGIDWLQQLGPVVTNYTMLSMKFHHFGSLVELRVDVQNGPLQSFAKQFKRMIQTGSTSSLFHLALQPVTTHHPELDTPHPIPEIQFLLTKYTPIFLIPSSLPLPCLIAHCISLHPSTSLVNVRPYHYPFFQNAKIEK